MKNLNKRSIVLTLISALTMFTLSLFADIEPNNDIPNAETISLNSTIVGSLNLSEDRYDYYKITVVTDGRLTLLPENTTVDKYKTKIYGINKDNTDYTLIHWEGNISENPLSINLLPGTYYVCIGNRQNSSSCTYSVQVNFQVLAHIDSESNDTKETASTLKLNQQNSGNLLSRKDGDWDSSDFWKVTIIEDGRLTVKDDTENTLNYKIFIRDEDGDQFKWENRNKDNSGKRIACNLTPGIYYIELQKISSGYENYGCYTIFPEFTPIMNNGDNEPNDSKEKASTLVLNQQSAGNLLSRKNGDWDSYDFWKITIPKEGRLTINDDTEPTLSYKILLHAEDMSTIKWENRPKDNSGKRIAYNLSPGIYYLEIRKDAGGYLTYGSYTIEPVFVPTKYQDTSEPNDKIEEAKELILDSKNVGSLGSRKLNTWDYVDYWKFTLTKETNIIFKDTTENTLSYKILLQHGDGSTMAWQNRNEDNIGDRIEKKLAPGDYLIKIDNQYTGTSTYGSYSIYPQTKSNLGITTINSMFSIYPNPVKEILYIKSQINRENYIEIIDINGRIVASKLMKTISGNIDLSSLNKGAYYVRITNDEFSTVKKIVIE